MAKQFATDADGKLSAYAWPGGYPIFYVCADNGVLCPKCANNENSSHATTRPSDCPDDRQWQIMLQEVNWDDANLHCDHCSARIESAYAED